jgi:hypothetical protein
VGALDAWLELALCAEWCEQLGAACGESAHAGSWIMNESKGIKGGGTASVEAAAFS